MLRCGDSSRLSPKRLPDRHAGHIAAVMPFVLALDQGTTSSRAIVFDESGTVRVDRAARVPADLSAARLGRARRGGDLAHAARGRARGARQRAHRRPRPRRRSASRTSARRRSLWDRRTGAPLANAIVWQDRRTADALRRACKRDGARAAGRGEDRARARPLLLRRPSSRGCSTRPGRAPARGARRARLRHDRHLARRGSSRRPRCTSPIRPNASRTLLFDIDAGRWDEELLALFRRPARAAARGAAVERRVRRSRPRRSSARRSRSPASPATSRPRSSARRASRRAWRRTPTAPAASCC